MQFTKLKAIRIKAFVKAERKTDGKGSQGFCGNGCREQSLSSRLTLATLFARLAIVKYTRTRRTIMPNPNSLEVTVTAKYFVNVYFDHNEYKLVVSTDDEWGEPTPGESICEIDLKAVIDAYIDFLNVPGKRNVEPAREGLETFRKDLKKAVKYLDCLLGLTSSPP